MNVSMTRPLLLVFDDPQNWLKSPARMDFPGSRRIVFDEAKFELLSFTM